MPISAPLSIALVACSTSAHAWWDAAWAQRERLAIVAVDLPDDVGAVPVAVRLDGSRVPYADTHDSGADLRFVASDDRTRLTHHIEKWDPSGESVVWVELEGAVAGTLDEVIYLYFDNPSASRSEDRSRTYDFFVDMAYHLDAGAQSDLISGAAATNGGSTVVPGYIGDGRHFDGNSARLDTNRPLRSLLSGTSTFEVWIRTTDGSGNARSGPAVTGWRKGSASDEELVFGYVDIFGNAGLKVGTGSAATTTDVPDGTWHHLALTRDEYTGVLEVWLDGTLEGSSTGDLGAIIGGAFDSLGVVEGTGGTSTVYLEADLDEVRVHGTVRSEAWIKASMAGASGELLRWCRQGAWFRDADGDGYGDPGQPVEVCLDTAGAVDNDGDCNDGDPTISPDADDVCGDGLDRDCDGVGGPQGDEDGDGLSWETETAIGGDDCDLDTDSDTVPDAIEGLLGDSDGDGDNDINDIDDDNDFILTAIEGQGEAETLCPGTPLDGIPNYLDDDSEGDGRTDYEEGTADADGDSIPDYLDCVADGCTGDQDGDGFPNCAETDYGTSPIDPDTDHDTVGDLIEVGGDPFDPQVLDTDGDGILNALDTDDDGDGLATALEDPNGDGLPENDDIDGDGLQNYIDDDDDNDTIPTALEDRDGDGDVRNDDTDGDGWPDYIDADDDGDGTPTAAEDRDGSGDPSDDDFDGDGIPDYLDPYDVDGPLADADSDGLRNDSDPAPYDVDADDDGIPDGVEHAAGPVDTDGDGLDDAVDDDDDDDGLPTIDEPRGDADGDGIPNHLDPDADGDGVIDGLEKVADSDCDGLLDVVDATADLLLCEGGVAPPRNLTWQPGCGCASAPGAVSWWLVWVTGVVSLRRGRRPRVRRSAGR